MSIASEQDIITALGLSTITDQAQMAWDGAEVAICEYLHWRSVEQTTWYEYFVLSEPLGISGNTDPAYIKGSSGKTAVPGFYLAPDRIQLRQIPVRQILAVYEDATAVFGQYWGQLTEGTTYGFESGSLLQQGNDYYLVEESPALNGGQPISWSGHLVRRGWWYPAVPGSVLVQGVSGFTAAELSGRWRVFKDAVIEETIDRYLRFKAVAGGQFPAIASEGLGGGASTSYRDNHTLGFPCCDSAAEKLTNYVFMGELSQ